MPGRKNEPRGDPNPPADFYRSLVLLLVRPHEDIRQDMIPADDARDGLPQDLGVLEDFSQVLWVGMGLKQGVSSDNLPKGLVATIGNVPPFDQSELDARRYLVPPDAGVVSSSFRARWNTS